MYQVVHVSELEGRDQVKVPSLPFGMGCAGGLEEDMVEVMPCPEDKRR